MTITKCIVVLIFIATSTIDFAKSLLDESDVLSEILPKVSTFADISEKCGRMCEEYNVTTEDGYILKLFHIPGNSSRPVLLMPGVLDTSDTYILREENSLSLTLADQDYDVWVGNSRGNRYCRHHLTLNPDTDKAFWDFSFHQMGYYDLPATIDFILKKTGQSQLTVVGHSEGTTIFYVLTSTRPEYNDKIKVIASLAPIAYLHHAKSVLAVLIKLAPALNILAELLGYEEIVGFKSDVKSFLRIICDVPDIGYEICTDGLFNPLVGPDSNQLEADFLPTYIKSYPAGTSRVNLVHFSQVGNRKKFAQYDYGAAENLVRYGSVTPPEYDLSKITTDVALYLGLNDFISTREDVNILRNQLPNVVEYHELNYTLWNHFDHVIGRYMPKYLFPPLLELLEKYN